MLSYGLFDYEELIEHEPEEVIFGKVRFVTNFGPWKRGDYCSLLYVCFETGRMEHRAPCGTVIQECDFTIVPKDTNGKDT